MIREHDRIVLREDVQEHSLKKGDVGIVVHVYPGRKGFEVEFIGLDGVTIDVFTLSSRQVRAVKSGEIPNARSLSTT